MKIQLSLKYVIAFLALTFLIHEAHEIAHTTVGRLICGCWGQRDFNVWNLCEGCPVKNPISIVSTFAGPILSFSIIWLGAYLTGRDKTEQQKAMGFSLIFASTPFARILTASLGSGDEVWGLNYLIENHGAAWIIGLLVVVAITIIPIVKAFKLIENNKRIGWFLLFFLAPTIIDILVVLGILNILLSNGVLSDYWILGSPAIVTVWTILVIGIFFLTKKNIYALSVPTDK